jgi:hypothetical protein
MSERPTASLRTTPDCPSVSHRLDKTTLANKEQKMTKETKERKTERKKDERREEGGGRGDGIPWQELVRHHKHQMGTISGCFHRVCDRYNVGRQLDARQILVALVGQQETDNTRKNSVEMYLGVLVRRVDEFRQLGPVEHL